MSQGRPAGWWLAVQLCLAAVLVLVGVTVVAAGGMLSGPLVAGVGAFWVWRCYRVL